MPGWGDALSSWPIFFLQAECSLSSMDRRRRIYWQVHMTLFPYKRHRHKTSYKTSLTPIFNQSFDIEEIATHALSQMSVR